MAKKGSAKSTDAIQRLLDEKREIEQWLDRLDSAADKTPSGVRAKVKSDYQKRLGEIVAELQEHRDNLAAALADQRKKREQFASQEEAASERLAEAELRHTVGEYDEKKWAALKSDIVESLVRMREGLKEADEQIAALEEIMLIVDHPSSGAGAAASDAEDEVILGGMEVRLDEVDEPRPSPRPAAPEPSAKRGSQTEAFDELAFLKSITGDEPLNTTPGRASGAQKRPPAPPKARPSGAAQIGAEGVEALSNEPTQPSKGTAAKTLKCAECGAKNLPTEWYCERCGAELAAL